MSHSESWEGRKGRGRGKGGSSWRKDKQRPFPPFPVLPGHATPCEYLQVLHTGKYLPSPSAWLLSGNEYRDCLMNGYVLSTFYFSKHWMNIWVTSTCRHRVKAMCTLPHLSPETRASRSYFYFLLADPELGCRLVASLSHPASSVVRKIIQSNLGPSRRPSLHDWCIRGYLSCPT